MKYLASIIILIALTVVAAERKHFFPQVGPCPKCGGYITNAIPFKISPGWEGTDGTNFYKSDIYWFKCPKDKTKFPAAGTPKVFPVPRAAIIPPLPKAK